MIKLFRQKMIINSLGTSPTSVDTLVELTGASPATIRRDLTDLEGHGQLRKVHGGAVAVNLRGTPMPYSLRSAENAESKTALAQLVSRLVTDDMSVIIIDNGSTMVAVAQALQERPITALCLSLRAALPLGGGGVATVSTPDGTLMPESLRYEAASCLRALGEFRADVAIVGTCSASPAMGLTVTTHQDAQVKRAILASSARVVLAATGDKLSRTSSFRFGDIKDIDDLVTTRDAPQVTLDAFRVAGSRVYVAD
ncbi:transcriptional regulator, DeoR family [Cutibacterium acnes HL005PA2]|uniref:DeoR/GlpR family DNA-binding transcription regulator n=1 Tax=Cutibacterium acnes TaxID=1747 RepID=UPI0001F0A4A3|nr:DeoR/GlpR family DNA-binding transcription regulator [Cutibacterium acnes]EFT31171.1 transcriptional regulator, DeoR family [Cutibacterium acnes HL005PA2]EFT34812.1 transcriptional regulator, DeoR family [Cutibacterium acnes HL005PA3]